MSRLRDCITEMCRLPLQPCLLPDNATKATWDFRLTLRRRQSPKAGRPGQSGEGTHTYAGRGNRTRFPFHLELLRNE